MLRTFVAAAIALSAGIGAAWGQDAARSDAGRDWPNRPVTMVVPFAAGGAVDVLGRVLAARLGEILGQQIIIENAPGAGGMTGTNRVAKAAPDGYQFVLGSVGTHAQNQSLYKKPIYNAATEFEHVIVVAELPLILVTRKDLPVRGLDDFIAFAKANQSSMQYGSAGTGSAVHLGCVMLNAAIGINVTHIPYRGGGPAMQDLIAGRIDYTCNIISTVLPQVKEGLVHAVANLGLNRSPLLPDFATAREQGLDFNGSTWNILSLPKGTPQPIVQRLNAAASEAMDSPATRQRLLALGLDIPAPERRSAAYANQFVADEIARWAGPIKSSGVSAD